MSRGLNWLQALAGGQALAGYPASVKVVDGTLDRLEWRLIPMGAVALQEQRVQRRMLTKLE